MGDEETEDGLKRSSGTKINGLIELDEFCRKAYESSSLYIEKIKITMTKRLRSANM